MKIVVAAVGLAIALPLVAVIALAGAPQASAEALEQRVLSHPGLELTSAARGDIEQQRVDARVLEALLILAEDHRLSRVGPLSTGHSYFVKGTQRVSNHVIGRAVDIGAVDGVSVSLSNSSAAALVRQALDLPAPLRPDEVGSPWDLPDRGSFADRRHLSHIHLGWSAKP